VSTNAIIDSIRVLFFYFLKRLSGNALIIR
jgi:hypothetical protein